MIPTTDVDPDDPAALYVVGEVSARLGYNIRQVFSPGSWRPVRLPDGEVDIALSPAAMRAIAVLSPDPEATRRAERLIAGWSGSSSCVSGSSSSRDRLTHNSTSSDSLEEATAHAVEAEAHAQDGHVNAAQAHDRASGRHIEAAEVHERVADVLDEHGRSKRAQTDREAAEQDRDAAADGKQAAEDDWGAAGARPEPDA